MGERERDRAEGMTDRVGERANRTDADGGGGGGGSNAVEESKLCVMGPRESVDDDDDVVVLGARRYSNSLSADAVADRRSCSLSVESSAC